MLLHDLRGRDVCPIRFSAGRDPVSLWTNGAEEHSMFPISHIKFFFLKNCWLFYCGNIFIQTIYYFVCMVSRFSHVQLFVMLWTVAHQASLSIGFPSQEYWNGLPYPSPGDLPDPGIEPMSPALTGGFFTTSATWDCILLWVLVREWLPWYKKLEAKTSLWKLAFLVF